MAEGSHHLSNQIYEMGIVGIVGELLGNLNSRRTLQQFLLAFEEEDDDDDPLFVLLKQAQLLAEEESLMNMVQQIFSEICNSESHIFRPYQSHFRTDSGCNRMRTKEDLELHFGVEALRVFRFSLEQIDELMNVLQVPTSFIFCGHHCSGVEALAISLHRMSSHIRFLDLSYIYDLLPSFLSQIFGGFMLWIFSNFGENVRSFEHPWTVDRDWLELFASKLLEKGCPLGDCFGFIDGTHIAVCRPSRNQRSWYCGHHHCHCFKSLVIQLPNGILLSFGPFNGSQHDSSQAQDIQIDQLLSSNCSFPDRNFVLYADSGFAVDQNLITPFRRGRNHTDGEAEWNREMSRHRISVEWGIGRCKQLFQMMTNKNNLKCLMSPVSTYWFNSIFFTNLHTCINRRCQVSDYFDLEPPTLMEYINS